MLFVYNSWHICGNCSASWLHAFLTKFYSQKYIHDPAYIWCPASGDMPHYWRQANRELYTLQPGQLSQSHWETRGSHWPLYIGKTSSNMTCASCPPAMILHTHIELGAESCHWVQAWWDCVPTQSWYYLWAAGATRQGYRVAHIGKSIYTDLMRSTTLIVFFPCLSAASQCSRRERGLAWTGQSS